VEGPVKKTGAAGPIRSVYVRGSRSQPGRDLGLRELMVCKGAGQGRAFRAPLHRGDNVYTKVLQQAAELEGSTQALAARLRVPENTRCAGCRPSADAAAAFFKRDGFVGARESQTAVQASGASERSSPSTSAVLAHCSRCEGTEVSPRRSESALHYARNLASALRHRS